MGGKEHDVVCEDAEVALAGATRVGPPEQGAAEPSLVPGEGALGLPPLAVHPPVPGALGPGPEPAHHLVAVRAPTGPVPPPRRNTGITLARMPRSARANRWLCSASNAASASTRSHRTPRRADASRTGANCGESLDGPRVTVAPAKKWERVSQAVVSLGYDRAVCSPRDRATKYREAWRASRPVASTATVGASGIRPVSSAAATVPRRSWRKLPLLAAAGGRN